MITNVVPESPASAKSLNDLSHLQVAILHCISERSKLRSQIAAALLPFGLHRGETTMSYTYGKLETLGLLSISRETRVTTLGAITQCRYAITEAGLDVLDDCVQFYRQVAGSEPSTP